MNKKSGKSEGARRIGVLHGCRLDVVPDTLWRFEADLAVAGIHLRDPKPAVLSGLELVIGDLKVLRRAGLLTGKLGETLLLSKPPAPIKAGSVMILGLGPVRSVTADTVYCAAKAAADQAAGMQVRHVASACGGDDGAGASDETVPHLWAAIAAIEFVLRASRQHVRRWSFLSAANDLDVSAERFRTAFRRAISSDYSLT